MGGFPWYLKAIRSPSPSQVQRDLGRIIAMTDSDCIVPQNWLCKITKPIISGQEKISLGFEYDLINNYWTRNIQKSNWDFVNRKKIGNYIKHIDTKNFAIDAILMKEFMFNEDLVSFEDFELYLRIKDKSRIFFNPEIKVGHRHKTSLIQVIKLNIDRAIWNKKIFKLYKEKTINQKKEPMFESLSLINFLLFPFWAIFQFTKKPFSRVFFLIISEASWRIGLLISR